MNDLMTVEFRGATLFGRRDGDTIYVALKPIVEAMGLSWHGQLERTKRHPVFSQGIRVTRIPSPQGDQDTVCLRLGLIPGWLSTVNPRRVRSDLRENVMAFQTECFEVLWKHFSGEPEKLTKDAHEATSLHLRLCEESRRIHGNRAADQLWTKLGLPRVPAMDDAFRQGDLFNQPEWKKAA